ncbi:hypothetical protein [Spirilliplanes yamanashiensis]|uniref:DUF1449 family protein n=1 Tax=Spirilliplanes yamanashiensis TaxID=42233 RepID=A0A8J3Y6B7_9ACTN|nr:hypothetical protein [Spirilliplanes yamanashiensis]MDP9814708.1 hypothetical protein [Spirilliplanes yamanashiensis]GIJ02360.1 hypothetical protein Sya03_17120 [Spirilliplanes yamanashiensis]
MGGFVEAALSFPTVLFTFLLAVVVVYWLVVMVGGADTDSLGEDAFGSVGLGGVPVTVALSLLIAVAWFVSLAGAVLLENVPGAGAIALAAALVTAWVTTRLLVAVLRRAMPTGVEPSRQHFLGRTAVIRTQRVTDRFGQAEVAAADGSTALVQVRQAGQDELRYGTVAVLYDFDADGEFFWVVPADVALEPRDSKDS